MKAVLVIDMPMMCCECKFFRFANNDDWESSETICTINGKHCENGIDYKPRVCPLRPLPSKKEVTVKRIEDIQSCSITEVADNISARIILKTDEIFALGWNACLDSIIGNDRINEITGEKDESNINN